MTAILRVRDENGNIVDIPAIKGKDGHTPIKGVDYFTEAEKTEMVAAVKNQLIVEQWTFTLMDDTVVTKDVVVE